MNLANSFRSVQFLQCQLSFKQKINSKLYTAKTKCRKFETNIPRKGMSGPQSQFPHLCVCERIIYSHGGSAFSAGGNMWTDPGNIQYKSLTDTWMWKLGLRPRYSQERNILYNRNCRCSVRAIGSLSKSAFEIIGGVWRSFHAQNWVFDHFSNKAANHIPKHQSICIIVYTERKLIKFYKSSKNLLISHCRWRAGENPI